MKIRIEPHTLQRAIERGVTEVEIKDTIETGLDIPAKHGRQAKEKTFDFNRERQGIFYKEKRVEVIYIMEEKEIATITVYAFYGYFSTKIL